MNDVTLLFVNRGCGSASHEMHFFGFLVFQNYKFNFNTKFKPKPHFAAYCARVLHCCLESCRWRRQHGAASTSAFRARSMVVRHWSFVRGRRPPAVDRHLRRRHLPSMRSSRYRRRHPSPTLYSRRLPSSELTTRRRLSPVFTNCRRLVFAYAQELYTIMKRDALLTP